MEDEWTEDELGWRKTKWEKEDSVDEVWVVAHHKDATRGLRDFENTALSFATLGLGPLLKVWLHIHGRQIKSLPANLTAGFDKAPKNS